MIEAVASYVSGFMDAHPVLTILGALTLYSWTLLFSSSRSRHKF